ncbi:MAG: type II toxin-antitoxin system HicB family antitoxin [Planctomycetes bacterium]|jgi:predicted RNase H-like HicB family nuclease|nr:type II toxin-antitoxin system HicB family antitoxin [Planctomycetota bacterium]
MSFPVEVEQEEDGRWLADVPDLPGVMIYAESRDAAISKVQALALRVLAEKIEHGEPVPPIEGVFSVVA